VNGKPQIGLTRVGDDDVRMLNCYALDLLDLVELA